MVAAGGVDEAWFPDNIDEYERQVNDTFVYFAHGIMGNSLSLTHTLSLCVCS